MKLIWIFAIVALTSLNYETTGAVPLTKWFKTDNGTYYIEESEKYTWQQAYDECQKKNMALISVKTYKADTILLEYIKQSFDPIPEFWLKSSDRIDLADINKFMSSMFTADFLNIKLDGLTEPEIVQSNNPKNCALTADGIVKACEDIHGFICSNQNRGNSAQSIQNIVLKFN